MIQYILHKYHTTKKKLQQATVTKTLKIRIIKPKNLLQNNMTNLFVSKLDNAYK